MKKAFNNWIWLSFAIMGVVLFAAGCGSSGGGGGAAGGTTATGTTPSSITLSASPATISAGGTSTISATVTDGTDPVSGVTVTFSVSSLYGTVTSSATTTSSGVATATFTSSGQPGTVTITGSAGSVSDTVDVTVTPVAAFLSIGTSKTSIQTDGTDSATITATVLDASRVPIEGLAVNFSTDAGQLSASNVETDANGEAAVTLSGGTIEKENQVITVTATVQSLVATIPIQLTGTTVALSIDNASLPSDGSTTGTLTVTVKDAKGTGIYNADVTLTQSGSGSVTLSTTSGTTGVNGTLDVTVTGQSAGDVTITATSEGASASTDITITGGDPFEITTPSSSSVSQKTNTSLAITVKSPDGNNVKFFTSMGTWAISGTSTTVVTPDASNDATATLNVGGNAGIATVRVEDATNSSINDSLQVAVYAPASEAAKLSLQVSPSTIGVSGGGVTNSAVITAMVKNSTGEVVGDAPVMFTLFRTTGGGEYVSPPIVYSQSNGTAETTFYSGSLTSDNRGVFCLGKISGAVVAGPDDVFSFNSAAGTITRSDGGDFTADGFVVGDSVRVSGSAKNDGVYTVTGVAAATLTVSESLTDEDEEEMIAIATSEDTAVVPIIINSQAASVAIGIATTIEEYDPATYQLPMSVLVSDSAGNPVSNATVTLSVWPIKYATGYTDPDKGPVWVDWYWSEDRNRNNELDAGEDTNGCTGAGTMNDLGVYEGTVGEGANDTAGNGILDPFNSTAGNVPVTVTTDTNGVAQFYHTYQKQYSPWIKVEYRASVTVGMGEEAVSTLNAWLPYLEDEKQHIPNSPWGIGGECHP